MRFCCKQCQQKSWNIKNAERCKENKQTYYSINKEKIKANVEIWQKTNPEKTSKSRKKYKQKYKTGELKLSTVEKIKHALRARVNDVINGRLKGGSAIQDLGCTPQELVILLETKFYDHPVTGEKMTWDNHGKYGWHIDHIEPLYKFDLTNPEQFKVACNYKNLQPLWAEENWAKNKKG